MKQLPLAIAPKLAYSADNFILHAGVVSAYQECIQRLSKRSFNVVYIEAQNGFGKTHLAVKVASELSSLGHNVELLDGAELANLLASGDITIVPESVTIIDDVDTYLLKIIPGTSGPFVSFIESIKRANGSCLMLSSTPVAALPCDEHVMSRLKSGAGLTISPPDERDLEALLDNMATQRGIKLQKRALDIVIKRVGRDVPALTNYLSRLDEASQLSGKAIKIPLVSRATTQG